MFTEYLENQEETHTGASWLAFKFESTLYKPPGPGDASIAEPLSLPSPISFTRPISRSLPRTVYTPCSPANLSSRYRAILSHKFTLLPYLYSYFSYTSRYTQPVFINALFTSSLYTFLLNNVIIDKKIRAPWAAQMNQAERSLFCILSSFP